MTDSYGVAFGQVEDPARDLLQGTPRTGVTLAAWLGQLDDIKSVWASNGAEFGTLSPQDFGKFVSADIKRWAEVVKASGAKLE